MTQKIQFSDLFEDKEVHRTILKAGLWFLLMLELVIFLWAAFHSGIKSTVAVYDANNNKIYETQGAVMTTYERRIFESSYGPLSNYRIKVESRSVPFPFRAWLAVAVGAPIGVVLLLNYLVRAYLTFLGGEEPEKGSQSESQDGPLGGQGFHPWFALRRLSIFSLGLLVVVCLALIWLVPDFMAEVAREALAFVLQFKWFFLGVSVFLASLVVWIIYLRYKIQAKMMEHQVDLEKFRLEKQLLLESNQRISLLGAPAASQETHPRTGHSGQPLTLKNDLPEGPYVNEEHERIEEADADTTEADEAEEDQVIDVDPISHAQVEIGNWTHRLLKRHR
jgi:hypothetical protein